MRGIGQARPWEPGWNWSWSARREQQAAIEALGPLSVEVVELNLEDAFIEYTRGPRSRCPNSSQELRKMIRAMAIKELRETAGFAALALVLYGAIVGSRLLEAVGGGGSNQHRFLSSAMGSSPSSS